MDSITKLFFTSPYHMTHKYMHTGIKPSDYPELILTPLVLSLHFSSK